MLLSCVIPMYPRIRSFFIAFVANPLLNCKYSFVGETFIRVPSFMAGFAKIFRSISFLIFVFDIFNMLFMFFQLVFNICKFFSRSTPKKDGTYCNAKYKAKNVIPKHFNHRSLRYENFIITKQGVKAILKVVKREGEPLQNIAFRFGKLIICAGMAFSVAVAGCSKRPDLRVEPYKT